MSFAFRGVAILGLAVGLMMVGGGVLYMMTSQFTSGGGASAPTGTLTYEDVDGGGAPGDADGWADEGGTYSADEPATEADSGGSFGIPFVDGWFSGGGSEAAPAAGDGDLTPASTEVDDTIIADDSTATERVSSLSGSGFSARATKEPVWTDGSGSDPLDMAGRADSADLSEVTPAPGDGDEATLDWTETTLDWTETTLDWTEARPEAPALLYGGTDAFTAPQMVPGAGTLTSKVTSDVFAWPSWVDYVDVKDRGLWGIHPDQRIVVELRDADGFPVQDTQVVFSTEQGDRVVKTSDGWGRIYLFSAELPTTAGILTADIAVGQGVTILFDFDPTELRQASDLRWLVTDLAVGGSAPTALDLMLVIDATGSMGDEMRYLKDEFHDIVRRTAASHPNADIRVSIIYYKDRGDPWVTRVLPFTDDIDAAVDFLRATSAGGGGDYPEEINAALAKAAMQDWSESRANRMLFLVADAPPKTYADARYTYHDMLVDAGEMGIAIYPVAASGANADTEYLFRSLAVMTGGQYVWLTDDSGIGGTHLEPSDAPAQTEALNDLIVRLIGERQADYESPAGGEVDTARYDQVGDASFPGTLAEEEEESAPAGNMSMLAPPVENQTVPTPTDNVTDPDGNETTPGSNETTSGSNETIPGSSDTAQATNKSMPVNQTLEIQFNTNNTTVITSGFWTDLFGGDGLSASTWSFLGVLMTLSSIALYWMPKLLTPGGSEDQRWLSRIRSSTPSPQAPSPATPPRSSSSRNQRRKLGDSPWQQS